jgi:hypothetical protein
MSEPWPVRAARILPLLGSSFAEYYLLCTAGYRINLDRARFIKQAALKFRGGDWPPVTAEAATSALDRLLELHLMTTLTEDYLRAEHERRAASTLPEVNDLADYRAGNIDFTEKGYDFYLTLIREICGDAHLKNKSAGFNLAQEANRFDIYAVDAGRCVNLMDAIQKDVDAYTGIEGATFLDREGPSEIGAWRPNRFQCLASGYHGIVRYENGR